MRPGVHVRPDRLRDHAAAAAELAGSLQAVLDGRGPAELDAALRRSARELAELGAVLAAAAVAAESADRAAMLALRRVGR